MKALVSVLLIALAAMPGAARAQSASQAAGQSSGLSGAAGPAAPSSRPVVMELFSSQNCGNCPVANANIAALARRPDVLALTYPVGYWDYLGAEDSFARPEFAERQVRYNRALGHRGPYTPQVIYNGARHGSGVNLAKIEAKFEERNKSPFPVVVKWTTGDAVLSGQPGGVSSVVLVRFRPGLMKARPGGGANRGKELAYYNLVTGLQVLGEWSGGEQRYDLNCTSGCMVLVHGGGGEGPIIGAAQVR